MRSARRLFRRAQKSLSLLLSDWRASCRVLRGSVGITAAHRGVDRTRKALVGDGLNASAACDAGLLRPTASMRNYRPRAKSNAPRRSPPLGL